MKKNILFFASLFISLNSWSAELVNLESPCGQVKICFYKDSIDGTIACRPTSNGMCAKNACLGNSILALKKTISVDNKTFSYSESIEMLKLIKSFSDSKGRLDTLEETSKLKAHLGKDRFFALKSFFEKGGKLSRNNLKSLNEYLKLISKKESNENFTLKETKFFAKEVSQSLGSLAKDEPLYQAVTDFLKLPLADQRKKLNNNQEIMMPPTAAMITAVVAVRVVETVVRWATNGNEHISDKYDLEVNDADFDMP